MFYYNNTGDLDIQLLFDIILLPSDPPPRLDGKILMTLGTWPYCTPLYTMQIARQLRYKITMHNIVPQ